ncbi:hypothetical protein [Micromonospora sp. HM5-17]|uniref:hypothetical protein n=1 Tax=Micromonospora sp. HM5-17 TaxID=2487710 RepID=UPI000F460237|nr:hypothetical protein [Micromonospora sp. HM5-17]ROT33744.1 hypothetical protein EF879_02170 [Micromonospora sp. HM5-17]
MSVPAQPAAPAARPRPAIVTVAGYLLFLAALMFVVQAVAGLATIGAVSDALKDVYAGTDVEGAETVAVAVLVATAVVYLLIAAGLVVLGLLNNRGNNVSRIITWVVGGLGVCCAGLGLGGSAFSGMGAGAPSGGANIPDPQEVQRRVEAAVPSWTEPVNLVSAIVALLALLAVVVLLVLPASNAYFRPRQAAWEPPVPGTPYPGQPYPGGEPAYPPYPSTPQAGQPGQPWQPGQGQPGQPPQPGQPGPGQPGQPPYQPPSS